MLSLGIDAGICAPKDREVLVVVAELCHDK